MPDELVIEALHDNVQAESFFATFKIELVEGGTFCSVDDARSEAFSYIEGYLSPEQVEKRLKVNNRGKQRETRVLKDVTIS